MEYKLLKEKVREYNKKDAQFYGNIFTKMNKLDQVKSAVSFRLEAVLFTFVMILILINPLAFTERLLFEILIHRMRP